MIDVHLDAYGLKNEFGMVYFSVKQDKGKLGLFGQINLKNGRLMPLLDRIY